MKFTLFTNIMVLYFMSSVKQYVMVQYLENTQNITRQKSIKEYIMYIMSYTTNPHMPRIRRDAVIYAYKHGIRASARHFGFVPSAVHKWKGIMDKRGYGPIPTRSCRPKSHSRSIGADVEYKIFSMRIKLRRSAEVVHEQLKREGVVVSLSSVKRTLTRTGLINKRSPWKRIHTSPKRPNAILSGDLGQVDTIHIICRDNTKIYVFTFIDIVSRWTYARAYNRCNARTSADFIRRAKEVAPFEIKMIQSDNGSEFSSSFTERIHVTHRHTRVGRPNDNAHIERFSRTLQEECLDRLEPSVIIMNRGLKKYLEYYNTERLHFGLNLRSPKEFLNLKCSQGID
jgi:transposase InsO family protein